MYSLLKNDTKQKHEECPLVNKPDIVQLMDNNYNESDYSQKCWITCLGNFNNRSDNLQNLCYKKLCNYTDSKELLSNNYPIEICKNLDRYQCFFSSDSHSNFIIWQKRSNIFEPMSIDTKSWVFSFINYKNFIILGLQDGVIQVRDVYNPKFITLTIKTNDDGNVHSLIMYKNLLISSSNQILIWDMDYLLDNHQKINMLDKNLLPLKKLDTKGKHIHNLVLVKYTLVIFSSNFYIELWNLNTYTKEKCLNYRDCIFPKPIFTEYMISNIIHNNHIVSIGNKKIVFFDKNTLEISQVMTFDFNVWQVTSYYNILLVSTSLTDIIVLKCDNKSDKYIYDPKLNIGLKDVCSERIIRIGRYHESDQCSAQLLVLNNHLHISIGSKICVINISELKSLSKI